MAQPQLRRRTSLRDKLIVWQNPTSVLDTVPDNEEERPRYVYQPQHAAADFSRLTIKPPSSVLHECRPCITGSETSRISRSQTRATRRAYRRPESANPLAEIRFRGQRRDMASPSSQQEHSRLSHLPRQPTQTATRPVPLTDYELFVAQAELEERAHQELMQTMEAQLHDSFHDLVRPDPHQQFASLSPTSLGAGSTAVAGTSRTTTGNKSRASRTSWAPSYANGGTVADIIASEAHHVSAKHQSHKDSKSHTVMAKGVKGSIHRSGTAHGVSNDNHTPQPKALTLKRQASFAQRIAEYIRPPRPDVVDSCRNETTLTLTRSGSRAGLRRLVAVPIHHIETLAE
ncbi:hypothetical protein B0H65DRAFT_283778 [Neurospora tetraspora]|uniref:Uncharacterized protein n=1 Tax=Neurospora tetraspora TaxID=94610 RepID=A0AAE0J933_9PEZI|nr:hypothetical protein B0H65DRAFT_283778 [Neurospora tetraspora]